ncbi:MAG: putative F420-0 ABC transporter substrate-binding protein [Salinibacterium sp.]|nr:putative F420-0 ABC transporter substrate-binding protein [Salinibacterium sp.]
MPSGGLVSTVTRILPIVLIGTFALAGCATGTAAAPSPTPSADTPVTVSNCGTSVTFTKAPERVVTIKSTSTEMLLALGLGDRIVGTAFQDGPVPDQWAADAASLTSIADFVPSEEVVLEQQPDLVYGGWESAFAADGAGTRPELATLGIATYVSPSACQSAEQPPKLTFANIFGDITQVASIFRVDPTELLAAQQKTLDGIAKTGAGHTAFWYSSGSDTPYSGAGIGAPELVMETVGLVNIAADVKATWAPLGWESVVDANPYYIVLIDATWNTAQSKIDRLESNPATAGLDAVVNKRYLLLPFASGEAGVRTVEAAASLSKQIAELNG